MLRRVAISLAVLAAPAAWAEAPPASPMPVANAMSVPAPGLPASDDGAAREGWIAECGRRIDAAAQGQNGAEPYRQTCAAWLSYFQRAAAAGQTPYPGGFAIPVSMVRTTTMVPCAPRVIERKVYVTRRPRHHDKRVWIAD